MSLLLLVLSWRWLYMLSTWYKKGVFFLALLKWKGVRWGLSRSESVVKDKKSTDSKQPLYWLKVVFLAKSYRHFILKIKSNRFLLKGSISMTNLAAKIFTYKTAWSHKLKYMPLFISLNYYDYQSCNNGMPLFAGLIPSLLENNIMFLT